MGKPSERVRLDVAYPDIIPFGALGFLHRAVTHLDVSEADCARAAEILGEILHHATEHVASGIG